MKKQYVLLLLCVWSHIALAQAIQGFTTKSTQDQLALETQFDAKLKKENLDEWMQFMAAEPHYVGTEYGKKNAEWMKEQFESWGYDVEIDEYQVLFPYPKIRLLELTEPTAFKAALASEPIAEDKYTQQGEALLPSYNAFSTDGDVTAELIFVNYGVPKDYEELEKLGIDVKGKIVIAKYYGSWRGIKPKLAAEKGAIGCIIYSDPADDGYVQGDVYPEGAFKPETGVQRGSVMDMPLYPGDVLTPGYGATKNAKRLDRKEAPTITKIPVLPISYADAQPFLEALNGPVAPSAWRGGLPITYHIGPGPAKVHLKLEFDWQLKPAYNVIAKLKGAVYPEEWVMRGNHHDAWVHGASDPVSGMVALMEEARAVGELAKAGQKPKRTIVYCAWDAEEPGLIGSTEWVEDHQEVLKDKAVVYINTDGNGRGFLGVGGSHTLETMVKEIAGSIEDPQTGVSLVERRAAAAKVANRDTDFRLSALGSGSDYTPFIQHTGIPSLNLGFGGESSGGEYHTIFDTYSHYTRFKDPGFDYGITLAKTAGHITLRMANADILPFEMNAWYITISEYMDEVTETTDAMRKQAEKQQQLVAENAYVIAADPKDNLKAPEAEKDIPYLDFSPLQNALASVKTSVHDFSKTDFTSLSASKQKMVNAKLKDLEKALLSESGLPRRPWFKHQIYAPGFYTGYGVKTLPGVREAIKQKNFEEAQEQIEKLAKTLTAFKGKIDEIVKMG
ncbi:transferrin receptor-like dimerization domain-containing protein [Leeuwenhoekiella sp. ZYFB001]|uniref:transferrin receptor-like dimerization domain-containing protein n=1 Tax=Leeuwenhoekiella sp. ZYFB001 TaxID=2719912 RepID=UPI00142FDD04|nr:transferrin receptor-like dimerization domain-containing protein [Leeuwenhoekiella sp. ZYFB001]